MWNRRNTFSISLAIVAATLLSSCLCAPAPQEPWWYRPCDSHIRIRHSRSTTEDLKAVKSQLKIFIDQLKVSKKMIANLYATDRNQQNKPKPPHAKLNWLKLKKMMLKIKKSKQKKIEEFYSALQHFAGTLEVLRNLEIETTVVNFNQERRNNIYDTITNHMRGLLCEVQDYLKVNAKNVPKGIPLRQMKIPISPKKKLDLTAGHLLDINFFTKTSSFFKRTQRMLFTKAKKNKSAPKSKRT